MLHQLAGSAMQAGASLLGKTARSYREDPATLATPAAIADLQILLQRTLGELKRRGILEPTLAAGQPSSSGTPGSSSASSLADTALEKPLIDLSSYEGLPKASVTKLMTIFYCGSAQGSCKAQLDIIEDAVAGGAEQAGEQLLYKLHQLTSSSIQAGAVRLGTTARAICEAATPNPSRELRLMTLDDVWTLRELLEESAAELRVRGLVS